MSCVDLEYKKLVETVLADGCVRGDRTGVGTKSIFGYQYKIPVSLESFPILTTKKVLFESVVKELLWFLSGSSRIADLDCGIWDAWSENGLVKWGYGMMWRSYPNAYIDEPEVDQIKDLVESLKTNPDSRRHIVCAWNPSVVEKASLPHCHCFFQCYVSAKGELDLQLYQRSADIALGVPFNISSYALLLLLLAIECKLKPRYFIHTFGDAHIYLNHVEKISKQILREPFESPRLEITEKNLLEYRLEDFKLLGYNYSPFIKYEVAV